MRKCDACGSDEIATVSTKYEGNYTECTKCGKRTYIPSYDELVYKVDALQARIDELEHKNEVLMDSYLESETIDDKGKLVGSLEYFKKRIADLETENNLLSPKATVNLLKPFFEHIKLEDEPMPVIHAGIKILLGRITELEKQLQSYKDFCSAIEREE